MAVGISAELDLEIKKLVSKLGQADARVGRFATEGMRKGERFAKGFEGAVGRGAQRAGGAVSRFFSGFRGAARAAVGVAAITTTLVILNRRFPVIGQVASKTFKTLVSGATGAVGATNNVVRAMGNLKTAATVAVGVAALARAYRSLRGSGGGDVKIPRLPSAPGGGGGIMGQVFGGTLLGGLASRGIGNAMDGVRNTISSAIDQVKASFTKAADMEQVQISFGVMLGSDGAANDMLKQLEQRASKTSFEMPSLTAAAQQLMQFDVAAENILPTLDMLGDISGGNAQKLDSLALAFGQMSSTGRLMGGELLQMINAGFNPLQEIAKRTGKDIKTLKKEMEMGDLDAEIVIQAFRDATSEGGRFYGMMAKQSKSAVGLMSTLRDAWGLNMLAFGQPVMESVKPLLADAIGLVERMKGKAVEFGEKLAGGIDFARAAMQEFSGGELLTMAGDGLKLAFMEAVNLLARGVMAVFKAAQDAEFMGELETRLEGFADKLKIALLEALGAAFQALRDVPKIGEELFGMGLSMEGAAADVKRDAREREKKKAPRESVDLGERFAEHWEKSGNILDTEALREKLRKDAARIQRRAARDKAARETPVEEGGAAPEAPTSKGPVGYANNTVQNAVNALFGRSMEAEQVSLLGQIAKTLVEIKNDKPKPGRPPVPGAGMGVGVFGPA
jgi:tape measure domain-containing protein